MKAKEIVLLVFIIVAGVFFYYAKTGKIDFDWEDYVALDWNEYTYEESQVIDPPLPASLKVLNGHGNVEVQGAETDKITFSFEKKIWRRNEVKAKEVADKLRFIMAKDDLNVTLSTNREEFKKRNFETNFRITVPLNMDIEVTNSYGLVKASGVGKATIANRHGEVIASEVNGELRLENSYEDVELENIHSNCEVKSKHSTILAKGVQGAMKIEQSYGKVELRKVDQNVTIDSSNTEIVAEDLSGTVDLQNSYEDISLLRVGPTTIEGHHSSIDADGVTGNLEIRDEYENIKVKNIRGNLSVIGKSLAVYGNDIIAETIHISSSYEDVELVDFSGKTTVLLSHGSLVLGPLPLTGPLEARCDYTPITLYWPSGERYPVEAQTKSSEINWRLPGDVQTEEKDGISVIRAFSDLSGRHRIFLSTSYDPIRIEEGFAR